MMTKTWLSAGVAIMVLLVSLTPVAADDVDDIVDECGDFSEDFEELSEDAEEFAEEVEEFSEEFLEFVDEILDDELEDAVATPFTATQTDVFEVVPPPFLDENNILHYRDVFTIREFTGDLGGSISITAKIDIDLATGLIIGFGLATYDVTFLDLSGTFEGCGLVLFMETPPIVVFIAEGDGDFEGMVLASVTELAWPVHHEVGTIFDLGEEDDDWDD